MACPTRMPDVNLQDVRHHRGSRHAGFEELSVQLFRSDISDAVEIIRVDGAGGDGGVEAFAKLANGNEIALQAKFFGGLGAKQWEQISKSVKTAFENHPCLVEYRVAVPLDRTPTQKKKWDVLATRWRTLALKKSQSKKIKFVRYGASEICDFLTRPNHNAKLLYWFGCRQFSEEWLDRNIEAAIADLDCRYTPKQHVRTSSEVLMDAFSLTERFVRDYYRLVKAVFDAGRKLINATRSENVQEAVPNESRLFAEAVEKTSSGFGNGKRVPTFNVVFVAITQLEDVWQKLTFKLEELNRPKEPLKDFEERVRYQGPFSWQVSLTTRFEAKLRSLKSFLK